MNTKQALPVYRHAQYGGGVGSLERAFFFSFFFFHWFNYMYIVIVQLVVQYSTVQYMNHHLKICEMWSSPTTLLHVIEIKLKKKYSFAITMLACIILY